MNLDVDRLSLLSLKLSIGALVIFSTMYLQTYLMPMILNSTIIQTGATHSVQQIIDGMRIFTSLRQMFIAGAMFSITLTIISVAVKIRNLPIMIAEIKAMKEKKE